MFLVWGKKRKERSQGFVADFCPICRDLRAFELIRVGMAGHIYHITLGEGKLVGFLIRCRECGVRLSVQPSRFATEVKDPSATIETLISKTFPNLREEFAERLEFESRIKSIRSTLSDEEYRRHLMEPFELLNPLVEQRFANSTEMDKPAGIGCLGTILLGAFIFLGSLEFNGPTQDKILMTGLAVVLIGTIYTFVQLHFGPSRFYKAKVLPPLVKALEPLKPSRDELSKCIERCEKLGMKIGKVTKLDDICKKLYV